MVDILHIIKTSAFHSDGRLLKWIESLSEFQYGSNVLIVEDKNRNGGFIYKKGFVKTLRLFSRKFFSQRKGYVFKIPEYSIRSYISVLKRPEKIVVFHDMQHYLTLFLLIIYKPKKIKLIWDLHELPHDKLSENVLSRKILKFILENVDLLVYTNAERRRYMHESLSFCEKDYVLLRNYPERKYIQCGHNSLDEEILMWLDGTPYILWMGWASDGRNFKSVLEALKDYKNRLKLIILGPVEPEMERIVNEHVKEGFIYQKFVPQREIIKYVDNSFFSIVLYKNSSPNNLLCEPNRLYQLLSRNIPVICGSNPPMRNIVEKLDGGIILEDDGTNVNGIKLALSEMVDNIEYYKKNLKRFNKEDFFSWEEQFNLVIEDIQKLN